MRNTMKDTMPARTIETRKMDTSALQRIRKEIYGVSEISPAFKNKIHELFYQQTRALTAKTRLDSFDVQFSDRWF